MTQPLVILVYERILPGSQLLNRFQDLGYRVRALAEPQLLVELATREKPLLVVADMKFERQEVGNVIAKLKANPATNYLPVIAIVPEGEKTLETEAVRAGANLVVNDNAVQVHLNQLLQQALQV